MAPVVDANGNDRRGNAIGWAEDDWRERIAAGGAVSDEIGINASNAQRCLAWDGRGVARARVTGVERQAEGAWAIVDWPRILPALPRARPRLSERSVVTLIDNRAREGRGLDIERAQGAILERIVVGVGPSDVVGQILSVAELNCHKIVAQHRKGAVDCRLRNQPAWSPRLEPFGASPNGCRIEPNVVAVDPHLDLEVVWAASGRVVVELGAGAQKPDLNVRPLVQARVVRAKGHAVDDDALAKAAAVEDDVCLGKKCRASAADAKHSGVLDPDRDARLVLSRADGVALRQAKKAAGRAGCALPGRGPAVAVVGVGTQPGIAQELEPLKSPVTMPPFGAQDGIGASGRIDRRLSH